MHKTLIQILRFSGILLILSCANPKAPNGGPKDTFPPLLDEEKSSENFQTHFQKQDIHLLFNEWIKLDKPFQSIIVSPPLEFTYDVRSIGKSIDFEFDEKEELKPNTTYTINFGNAIRDLNEGNEVEDYKFVFSTGAHLDSLRLNGHVVDAETGEKMKDVFVVLYDEQQDSLFRTTRPYYYTKTNEEGVFKFSYLKNDTFSVYALNDQNLNYYYDQAEEQIAFSDTAIVMNGRNASGIRLNVFSERPELRFDKVDTSTVAKTIVKFNQDPRPGEWNYDRAGQFIDVVKKEEKERVLWHKSDRLIEWNLTTNKDTFQLSSRDSRPDVSLQFSRKSTRFFPGKNPALALNLPLSEVVDSLISCKQDTLETAFNVIARIDSNLIQHLVVEHQWKEKSQYDLTFLPGALLDIWGEPNDTLIYELKADEQKIYGTIMLDVRGIDSLRHHIIKFQSQKGLEIDKIVGLRGDFKKTYAGLSPGIYEVTVIEDVNNNGYWDPGELDKKHQPERLMRRKTDQLRANWELEVMVEVAFED